MSQAQAKSFVFGSSKKLPIRRLRKKVRNYSAKENKEIVLKSF
jgi:hypothetical protein